VLSRYAKPFVRNAEAWRFLYESSERLRPVLAAYKEWTRPLPDAEIDHPARLYLIDGRGRIREIYSLAFFDETQAFTDIAALQGGGKKRWPDGRQAPRTQKLFSTELGRWKITANIPGVISR
jgi:hypothetical protein